MSGLRACRSPGQQGLSHLARFCPQGTLGQGWACLWLSHWERDMIGIEWVEAGVLLSPLKSELPNPNPNPMRMTQPP